MKAKSGFTLVEILIVVVILGILAAIVIPQFTNASTEAKTNSLMSNLQTVRSQIQLYKVQHNDNLPGVANGTHTAGAGFVNALIGKTDIYGEVGTTYGPYLQQIPKNPFTDDKVVDLTGTPGDAAEDWDFNTTTGAFYADDAAHSSL
jgi:general secretion pathway protein G